MFKIGDYVKLKVSPSYVVFQPGSIGIIVETQEWLNDPYFNIDFVDFRSLKRSYLSIFVNRMDEFFEKVE